MAVIGRRGVPADQAPALGATDINMGDVEWAVRAGIVADEEHFGQVVDGNHAAVPVGDGFGLNAQAGIGENAAPAFPDWRFALQAIRSWGDPLLAGGKDSFWHQFVQAIQMTERTFTLEAGTAVEVQAEDVGLVREGRCEAG